MVNSTKSSSTDKTSLAQKYAESVNLTITRTITRTKIVTAANDNWNIFRNLACKYISEHIMLFENPNGSLEISIGDISEKRPGYYKLATLEITDDQGTSVVDLLNTENQNQHILLDPRKKYRLTLDHYPLNEIIPNYTVVLDFNPK